MSHLPQRIASLQPSATLVVAELGALHRLVACTKYCADVCPAVGESKAAIIHDSWTADAAQILATRPDLVLASVPYQEKALAEILKAGIPVLALAPHSLRDVYADMALIAGVVGEAERGERLIERMQGEISEISKKAAQAGTRPRVFCEEWGKPIIVSQPWVAELACFAGGEFLGSPGKQITAEEACAAAPEVIVAAWCG
ncbi:MAG TPA: ABC transporter substrate-binding protein, partial [Terriglobales bacterium]|nr:ABC transporter substrate-binding protein [Terriglobales bacterium]